MSVLINLLLGVPILVAGLIKRRRTAIVSGAVLCAFALVEIAIVAFLLARRQTPPDVGLHSIVLIPVAIILAMRGARGLR